MTDRNEELLTLLKGKVETAQESKPKAIVSFFLDAISSGELKKGDRLPSINLTARFCKIACETVRRSYGELKEKGVVGASQGKGFFVIKEKYDRKPNVFLLFSFISNPYKALIARGIVDGVGNKASLNFCSHHNNENNFKNFLKEAIGKYEYYVVVPMRDAGIKKILSQMDQRKLLLADIDIDFPMKDCPKIVQNFDKNFRSALDKLAPELSKYKNFDLRYVYDPKNLHPVEIGDVLREFAEGNGFNYFVDSVVSEENVRPNTLWFVIEDSDLVKLMQTAKEKGLELRKDYGVLTYNDTEMKHIVEGGVSTVSIDFYDLGRKIARQILNWNPNLREVVGTNLIRGNTI